MTNPTIEVLSVYPPRKASMLAGAKVRLTFEGGWTVDIDDIRVLRNNRGELWIALPTYSVQDGHKSFSYQKTIELSRALLRQVEDCVIAAFEVWDAEQHAAVRP